MEQHRVITLYQDRDALIQEAGHAGTASLCIVRGRTFLYTPEHRIARVCGLVGLVASTVFFRF